MTGNETRRVLRDLALASPAVIDATAVSKDGVMLTVEPAEYASAEGADISDQEQVRRLRATQKPVMSGVFATVEGVNATDLEHPVFAPSGQFNGSASLLFRPTVLLTIAVQEALAGKSAEVFVMDTDGLMLYDRDTAEVGKYAFSDPMYANNPELLAVAERMADRTGGDRVLHLRGRGLGHAGPEGGRVDLGRAPRDRMARGRGERDPAGLTAPILLSFRHSSPVPARSTAASLTKTSLLAEKAT